MPVFGLAGRTEIGASFFCFIEYKIRIIASFYKDIVQDSILIGGSMSIQRQISILCR